MLLRYRRLIFGLLLAYQAFFLNVFLPGHTRGAITLDGKAKASCCSSDDEPTSNGKPTQGKPTQGDREQCAVCKFAAGITPTPPVTLTVPALGLFERRPPAMPLVVASIERLRTYLACGPPAASV